MEIFTLQRGVAPLLVSLPHDGTQLPAKIADQLTESARNVPDTDWHVAKLYAFARELGASIIVAKYSRYVIDLNRPQDDTSLYPGQNTTGLCPIVQFSGAPVYRDGCIPDAGVVRGRIDQFWRPYHDALGAEIARIRALHGRAVLWEGHSIRSVVPFLFDGRLPDFNLGTASGASCAPTLQKRLAEILAAQRDYSHAVNGRFKGGYITRAYGSPAARIDAVQLELAQCNYMDEISFAYHETKAEKVQAVLRELLAACVA